MSNELKGKFFETLDMKLRFPKYEAFILFIMLCQVFLMALPYLGISPPNEPVNLVWKIQKLLFFKFPIIWFIFIVTLFSIIRHYFGKKNPSINHIQLNSKIKEEIKLTKEHDWILLSLLNNSNLTWNRADLLKEYLQTFDRNVADFNIIENDLIKDQLISVQRGYHGIFWKLTSGGIEVAAKIHKNRAGD